VGDLHVISLKKSATPLTHRQTPQAHSLENLFNFDRATENKRGQPMSHCREALLPLSNCSTTKDSDNTPQFDGANMMQPMPKAP